VQLAGRGEEQVAELQDGDRTRLHRAVARDAQLADRVDDPGRLLRRDLGNEAERVPGGELGVDRIGLPAPATGVRMGLVDLEHADTGTDEMTGQAGGVGAGRLDADPVDPSGASQPGEQLQIARRGRLDRLGRQQHSAVVEAAA
jgi:hypothetical protein